ncbi:MAG TPA: hypothetical protein VMJ10_10585 [Kofleriaceae bacterium]|nr:hypothetical protein [Kofleriaceae bacterium]
MRTLLFVLVVACGGSQPAPASSPAATGSAQEPVVAGTPQQISEQIDKLKTYTAAMCQCEDPPCAKRVNDEMTADPIIKPTYNYSPDQKDQIDKITGRFNNCNSKAGGGGE